MEKFTEGGWVTLLITCGVIGLCYCIHDHYEKVRKGIEELDKTLMNIPINKPVNTQPINPVAQTAIQLVSSYNSFDIHALLSIIKSFPNTYKNVIFLSVAVIDTGTFKGADAVNSLEQSVESGLKKYVE